MQPLVDYLAGVSCCVQIDFRNSGWHTAARIPSQAGWYFIWTDTPLDVLQSQALWAPTYTKKKTSEAAEVNNFNIGERARRFSSDLSSYWNTSEVYSGMAASLQARAREHTFADPGTAGLALSKYPQLHQYEWRFGYFTLKRMRSTSSCEDMLLRLGEQLWRAKHGWPLLCAE
ncbi:MAG TPA: hypothetical protein VEG60_14480 [Candidatus Binatia bacterium]|nr:hypothetical protein [Candidatus Binatia bacterium]